MLVFIHWLMVIGVTIEMVKLVLTLIGSALVLVAALIALAVVIFGWGQFFDDFGNRRAIVLKCIIPMCIIGVAVLLFEPCLLCLLQTEIGMLWWRNTETHYFRLALFVLFASPVAFGSEYALADMFSFYAKAVAATVLIVNGNDGRKTQKLEMP